MTGDVWGDWARALLTEFLGVQPGAAAKMSANEMQRHLAWRIGALWGALHKADPERARTIWDEVAQLSAEAEARHASAERERGG